MIPPELPVAALTLLFGRSFTPGTGRIVSDELVQTRPAAVFAWPDRKSTGNLETNPISGRIHWVKFNSLTTRCSGAKSVT
jgi:hypothetical protein